MNRAVRHLCWLAVAACAMPVNAQQWTEVHTADRPVTVSASGTVSSRDALRFGPPPSRSWRITITELAREGSLVAEGDVLAKFDGSATDDRVRTVTGELNAKRSELESLLEAQAREEEETRVALAEAKSEKEKAERMAAVSPDVYAGLEYRKLLEQKDLTRRLYERELLRGDLVVSVRDAKRAELEADIRRLESKLEGAVRELESLTIRAPRPGLVIVGTNQEGQKLDVNESVNPGIVVVELANKDELIVRAEVPEYAAAAITVGQNAVLSVDAAGGSIMPGKVVSVASIVRRQSRFTQAMIRDVTISIPESMLAKLRPGMSAKVSIVVDTQQSAIAVPDSSIQYRDGEPGVTVRGSGWRPVVLGRATAGQTIVASGLSAGEEVKL
ncbi:MAG: HlyD family efflux transporter periplasmic adaptor subunit [Pseudomonadota bacterium]